LYAAACQAARGSVTQLAGLAAERCKAIENGSEFL
jgi:hypothetical protein